MKRQYRLIVREYDSRPERNSAAQKLPGAVEVSPDGQADGPIEPADNSQRQFQTFSQIGPSLTLAPAGCLINFRGRVLSVSLHLTGLRVPP